MDRVLARLLVLALVGILAFPALSAAQITRGAISGTVRDATGAVVPGASVTVTNMDTNISRSAVTDAQGFFRVPALEPGRYAVKAELSGFSTVEYKDIRLVSASEVTINPELKVAGVGEAITVVGRAEAIELNKTSAHHRHDHPGPRGRRAAALRRPQHQQPDRHRAQRQPRHRPGHVRRQRPALAQQQLHDRRLGQQRHQRHDRDDAGRAGVGGRVPGADERLQRRVRPQQRRAGQRHHQVRHEHASAARRGTTTARTSLASLTNLEKDSGLTKPADYTRHQAGASIGGPIIKDRTFFFAALPVRRRRPRAHRRAATVRIPTRAGFAALAGRAPAGRPAGVEPPGGARSPLVPERRLRAEPDLPQPRQRRSSTGCRSRPARPTSTSCSPSTYHTFMGRIDHRLTDSDNLTLRYYYNKRKDENAISNCAFGAIFCGSQDLKDTNLALSHTHVFGAERRQRVPLLLGAARPALPRERPDEPDRHDQRPVHGRRPQQLPAGPRHRLVPVLEHADLDEGPPHAEVRGGRALQQGQQPVRLRLEGHLHVQQPAGLHEQQRVPRSPQALQIGELGREAVADVLLRAGRLPRHPGPDPEPRPALRAVATCRSACSARPTRRAWPRWCPAAAQKDTNNWAPRVGFAWSPRSSNSLLGDGKTVFRGGFGMGYDVIFYNLLR